MRDVDDFFTDYAKRQASPTVMAVLYERSQATFQLTGDRSVLADMEQAQEAWFDGSFTNDEADRLRDRWTKLREEFGE